jgi:hypothetical protein
MFLSKFFRTHIIVGVIIFWRTTTHINYSTHMITTPIHKSIQTVLPTPVSHGQGHRRDDYGLVRRQSEDANFPRAHRGGGKGR